MNRRALALAATLALFVTPACVSTHADQDQVHNSIALVLGTQQAAWNAGDIEGFMRSGYWDSEDTTFLSGGTWTHGFAAVMERFKKRYGEEGAEMGQLAFTELETIALSERSGIARGRWELTFSDGSKTGGLFTLLLWKVGDGQWRIVHDHTSSNDEK